MVDNQTRPSEFAMFVSLSPVLGAVYNTDSDQNDVNVGDDFVLNIDPSLLIDLDKVAIGEEIAEGSQSVIHEGWYESNPVAIKIMSPHKASEATTEIKERFQREINTLSKTKHENIVTFVGACVDPMMVLLTERVKGGSLQQYLNNIFPRTLDLDLSLTFALDISRAMEYLRGNGIMHRDLHTGNLLLTEDKKHVIVADFGLAREEALNKMMTAEAGTYRWMAPEVMSKEPLPKGKKKCYDHKADVYSFAFVLWSLINNKKPFGGMPGIFAAYAAAAKNKRPSLDEIPEDIVPLLQSCWAEDPMQRPEFVEIRETLTKIFPKRFPTVTPPPCNLIKTENINGHSTQAQGKCPTPQTPGPNNSVASVAEEKKKNKLKCLFPSFFRCFRALLPNLAL
ncbi:hypothetical protein L6164_020009 [Bauhinia variegata]|uniref:Uncharacterized protein n=1 Tax=Bauhinia variegata TaxID=167791 RepID=A0ACB9MVR8_BAUVA|nr:hypothetical protein L6164_020009 [Bauhinia variegata]